MKKITQNDIANALGVSRRTVARALSNNPNITKDKKDMVIDYCEKVGYSKNTISSILAPGNKKNVYVFLLNSKNNKYFTETQNGILEAKKQLHEYNVDFTIYSTDINKPEEQISLLTETLKTKDVSGIIIIPIHTSSINDVLNEYDIKNVMTIDKPLGENISHIGKNYKKSGSISAGMIIRENPTCNNLLIVNTTSDNISSHLYYQGFKEHLESKISTFYDEIYIENLDKNLEKILDHDLSNVEYIFAPRFTKSLIAYLLEKGYDKIKYVSTGIDPVILDYLNRDIVISAINTSFFLNGYLSAKGIFKIIFSNAETFKFISNNELIIKENADNLNSNILLASAFNII